MNRFYRRTSRANLCWICESIGNGRCSEDESDCECFENFTGPTCSESSNTANSSELEITSLNMSAVAAGILGGILLFFIIGLIMYFFWRRQKHRKKKSLTNPSPRPPVKYVITPPLYTLPLSRENSLAPSDPDPIYEELP